MIRSGPLRLVEAALPSAAENVALDEALLRQMEDSNGNGVLRLWELDSYVVVLGRANHLERNVDIEACRADGVPIVRRCSGGGTVLLGPGALVFSLVLRTEPSDRIANVEAATTLILDRIREHLREEIGEIDRRGTSDLAIDDVKVSGNAQRWLRRTLLHHGTLLYDFDLGRIERYLTPPERQPEYRHGRTHKEFVRNVPLGRDQLRRCLIEAWDATLPPPDLPISAAEELVRDRYGTPEWTLRL